MIPTRRTVAAIVLLASVVTGCSSGGGTGSSPGTTIIITNDAPHTPPVNVVKTWPLKWCQAQIGMSRTEMRALMGAPTGEFGPTTSTPQMSWYAFDYGFDAFFDVNDKVNQLDVNAIRLTSAERASIRCADTRKGS